MKYKYIDEHTIEPLTKRYIKHGGRIYANPTSEQLKMAGYKELVNTECPELDVEMQFVVDKYIDSDDVITHVYEVHELSELEIEESEVIEDGLENK